MIFGDVWAGGVVSSEKFWAMIRGHRVSIFQGDALQKLSSKNMWVVHRFQDV